MIASPDCSWIRENFIGAVARAIFTVDVKIKNCLSFESFHNTLAHFCFIFVIFMQL